MLLCLQSERLMLSCRSNSNYYPTGKEKKEEEVLILLPFLLFPTATLSHTAQSPSYCRRRWLRPKVMSVERSGAGPITGAQYLRNIHATSKCVRNGSGASRPWRRRNSSLAKAPGDTIGK